MATLNLGDSKIEGWIGLPLTINNIVKAGGYCFYSSTYLLLLNKVNPFNLYFSALCLQ